MNLENSFEQHSGSSSPQSGQYWHMSHRSSYSTSSYSPPGTETLLGTDNVPLQGLGLNFAAAGQDLPSLMQFIGGYERAVGRAYLHQQSLLKSMSRNTPWENGFEGEHMQSTTVDAAEDHLSVPSLSTTTTPITEQMQFPWTSPALIQATSEWSSPMIHSDILESVPAHYFTDAWPTTTTSSELTESRIAHIPWSEASDLPYSDQKTMPSQPAESLSSVGIGHFPAAQSHQDLDSQQLQKNSQESLQYHTDVDIRDSLKDSATLSAAPMSPRSMSDPPKKFPLLRSTTDPTPLQGQATKTWTKELDEMLREEVRLQMDAGLMPLQWTRIARQIGKRSGVQCQARWAEVLDEKIHKGRWKDAEDTRLRHLYQCHGGKWSKIALEMITRTQRQCRSRWLQMNGAATL